MACLSFDPTDAETRGWGDAENATSSADNEVTASSRHATNTTHFKNSGTFPWLDPTTVAESSQYDGLILGAGHNALVLGAYLARCALNLLH